MRKTNRAKQESKETKQLKVNFKRNDVDGDDDNGGCDNGNDVIKRLTKSNTKTNTNAKPNTNANANAHREREKRVKTDQTSRPLRAGNWKLCNHTNNNIT